MAFKSILPAGKVALLFLGFVLASGSFAGEAQRVQASLAKKQEEVLAIETELSGRPESSLQSRRLQAKLRRLQDELKDLQKRKSAASEIKD
ncbi:hypothetical protein [Bdellovibrio sp.]|uniref:hypothetical protein n=1 Tax=Bdellovibrio TaxID=958 RepID=UPI003221A6D1